MLKAFFIHEPKAGANDYGIERLPARLSWGTKSSAELCRIAIAQIVRQDQLGELEAAAAAREFSPKARKKSSNES